MATYTPDDISRELSCPICFEDYDIHDQDRAPKLLLCLHTFCTECTRKLYRRDATLECSLCRMVHEHVSLDELFDNHVIVQYLRQESEEKDLAMARRLDEALRRGDNSPRPQDDEVDASWDGEQASDVNNEVEAEGGEDLPLPTTPAYAGERLFRNFFDELMGNFGSSRESEADNIFAQEHEEGEDDEDDNEDEDEEEEEEEEEEGSDEMEPEEAEGNSECRDMTNPSLSLSNIQALFGQIEENPTEEEESDDGRLNNMSSFVSFLSAFGQTVDSDNDGENDEDEENLDVEDDGDEEDEDEEERWHSASDEFQNPAWAGEDGAGEGNEREEPESDNINLSEWQIITPVSFLGD